VRRVHGASPSSPNRKKTSPSQRRDAKELEAPPLNLEAESEAVLCEWIYGIHKILTSAGKQVVDGEGGGSASKADKKYDVSRQPKFSHAAVKDMIQGMYGTGYWLNQSPKQLFLFFEPTEEGGAFYWCAVGRRDKSSGSCLPVSELCDVYMGKQQDVWKTKAGEQASEERCFSLIGVHNSIHFEADRDGLIGRWIEGIDNVLKHAGKDPIILDHQEEFEES